MIPPEFIQALLSRVDIVDVIERHVPLKRAGANFSACCPFHNEKTPSFTVSPAKQFYHCFGCSAHGTAISFLIEYQGLSFVEAVKELAGMVGMVVPESQALHSRARSTLDGQVSIDAIHEALHVAMHYFRGELKRSEAAIAYLKQRGVSGEVAAKFGLGYAPDGWQGLATEFPDYQSGVLLQAGLVVDSPEGRRYDRFRNRVMFPILGAKGNVIGFGGRVMGEGEPKYLNSPETPVFEKGHELYGLTQARRAIRDGGEVIVVEGYMDVVALAQHGVENAVATLGTATTGTHIQKLLRQADQIVFSFDGDKAGRGAAWRALENSLPELVDKKQISFLFLPEGHDPDSFIREFGGGGFMEKLRDALPLSEFFLRELKAGVNLRSQEGRAQLTENAKPLVQKIKAPIFSLQIRKRLAQEVGLAQGELDREYGIKGQVKSRRTLSSGHSVRQAPSLARQLLKCLIAMPELARGVINEMPDEPCIESDVIPEVIGYVRQATAPVTTAGLIQGMADPAHHSLLNALCREIMGEWQDDFDVQKWFDDVLRKIDAAGADKKFEALQAKSQHEKLSLEEKAHFQRLISTRT
ncbi:MAG: DNA primase [Pseudomonadota bacterium]